jgi:DNA gyrase/topoisomerase IV subunit A
MEDIRSELRERLKDVQTRLDEEKEHYGAARRTLDAEHANNMEKLTALRAALITVFESENVGERAPDRTLPRLNLSLKDYFLTVLHTRGPMTKDELKDAAERAGYFDAATAGRATHTTLLNLSSSGRLNRLSDGRYAWPAPEKNEAPTSEPEEAS